MNSIQKRVLCNECFKQEKCKIGANNLMLQYRGTRLEADIKYYNNERCKGYISTKDALLLLKNEKVIIRNYQEEVIQKYKNKNHLCKCRKVGQIGLGFKKGNRQYEWSVLGRVLGSWSQAGGGGYFLYDIEHRKYIKVPSFKTFEKEKK